MKKEYKKPEIKNFNIALAQMIAGSIEGPEIDDTETTGIGDAKEDDDNWDNWD